MAREKSKGIVQSLGDLFFTIAPDMGNFEPALQKGLETAADGVKGSVGYAFENLGKEMMKKFTAPLAIATAANVAQFQALDREIRSVLTLFGTAPPLVEEAWGRMSAGITQVSRDVGGLEKDIADGLYQAISAGVPEEDVFEFLDVAQMAAIADKTADLTTAVDAITTVLNSFTDESLTAADASDILFAAVAQGKTTFGELGASIGRAAGTAANAGVKAAEFAASIATITQTGIQTTEAVSYLRAAITGLLRPSEDMDAIFRKIGFSSAEAAVPVIGLQPAFQAVVDAAGGSTSRLQELIGTAEGVSAILGITGEKADAFAASLAATEGSAGATARAFEIVDAGVGRSFGKLTEAFDRLGNYFGKLASQLVQPLVDFATDVVNTVADIFKALEPVFEAVIDTVQQFFKVLEIPVVKKFAAGIAALAISVGGLLGVLAPLIFSLGKSLVLFAKVEVVRRLAREYGVIKKAAVSAATAISTAYDKLALSLERFTGSTTLVGKATSKLSRIMQTTVGKLTFLSGAFLAVTAAAAAGIYLFDRYQKKLERIRQESSITAIGVDRLAESLGITLTALNNLSDDPTDVEIGVSFVVENQATIRKLDEIRENLGDEALRETVIDIGVQFQQRGATDTDLQRVLDNFQEIYDDIDLDIDIDDLIPSTDAISTRLRNVRNEIEGAFGGLGADELAVDLNALTDVAKGDLSDVADRLAQVWKNEGYESFIENLDVAREQVAGLAAAENYLADETVKAFEELSSGGDKLGFSTASIYTLDDAVGQLTEKYSRFTDGQGLATEAAEELREALTLGPTGPTRPRQFEPITADRLEAQKDAALKVAEAFQTVEEYVQDAYDTINENITSSMPLLDVYAGAVEQSFAEWKKGQDRFQTDIVAVAEFRKKLEELPPAVLEAFDNASLDKQAWLASLNPEQQEEAIAELNESWGAVTEAADNVWNQELPGVVQEAQQLLKNEYDALYAEALTAGAQTAFDFSQAFNEAASQWPEIAAHWLGATAAVLGGGDLGTVTLGGPQITAEFNVTNVPVTVNNPTGTPTESSVKNGLATATTVNGIRRGHLP